MKTKTKTARKMFGWRCVQCSHVTLEYRKQRPAACLNPACSSTAFEGYVHVYQQSARVSVDAADCANCKDGLGSAGDCPNCFEATGIGCNHGDWCAMCRAEHG